MLSLGEARVLQVKRQKKALTDFSIYMGIIIAVTILVLLFTDYFARYNALYALPVILFILVLRKTQISEFFRPKEFKGKVVYNSTHTERIKKYASHQAGVSYSATEQTVMDIVVKNETGKKISMSFEFDLNLKDIKEGCEVILLRFVHCPIIVPKN